MKTGCKDRRRIIDITAVKSSIKQRFVNANVSMSDFVKALVSLHAFTGCDTVSAFSGRGKVSALNLLAKESRYIELFKSIGESWDVSAEISSGVEEFVCKLYGYQIDDVNLLRYKLYCSKKGIYRL